MGTFLGYRVNLGTPTTPLFFSSFCMNVSRINLSLGSYPKKIMTNVCIIVIFLLKGLCFLTTKVKHELGLQYLSPTKTYSSYAINSNALRYVCHSSEHPMLHNPRDPAGE